MHLEGGLMVAEKDVWRQLIEIGLLAGAEYCSPRKGLGGFYGARSSRHQQARATGQGIYVPSDLSRLQNLDDKFAVRQRLCGNQLGRGHRVEE